jgi:hypothetical protein
MQLDETSDFSQCFQLLVSIRYVQADANKEQILFRKQLLENTKAVKVFEMVKSFSSKQKLDW